MCFVLCSSDAFEYCNLNCNVNQTNCCSQNGGSVDTHLAREHGLGGKNNVKKLVKCCCYCVDVDGELEAPSLF